MGCGSSHNNKAQQPLKKSNIPLPSSLIFDPLTTLRVVKYGSVDVNIHLTSGETEADQFPVISSRLFANDKYLTFVLTNLKDFTLKEGRIFPKISYSLNEKIENGTVIAANEDYHSFSTTGTDLSTPEIKIVLPLHSVKPKSLMILNVSIKDTKNEANHIRSEFMFLINPDQSRSAEQKDSVVECKGIQGSSMNQLNIESICVAKAEDDETQVEIQEPYILEYGRTLLLTLNELKGFNKNGDFVSPGCSLLAIDDEGNEIFFKPNLFPEDNEYHEDDLSEFRVKIDVGGANFRPLRDYWLNVRLWDRKGNGQLGIKIKYRGSNKSKERVKIFEVKENGADFTVKCKGESGFLSSKLIYINMKKEKASPFEQNLEKSVEIELEFDEKYQEKKQDILEISNSNDGIEKKPISWRLISLTAPN